MTEDEAILLRRQTERFRELRARKAELSEQINGLTGRSYKDCDPFDYRTTFQIDGISVMLWKDILRLCEPLIQDEIADIQRRMDEMPMMPEMDEKTRKHIEMWRER